MVAFPCSFSTVQSAEGVILFLQSFYEYTHMHTFFLKSLQARSDGQAAEHVFPCKKSEYSLLNLKGRIIQCSFMAGNFVG